MFLFDPADIPDPERDACAKARVEAQLAGLQKLAEIGLDLAGDLPALQRQPGADPEAIAMAFSRLSRSIRLTYTLENRIAEGRLAVETRVATKAARAVDHVFEGALFNHRWRVEDLVGDQLKAESGDDDDRFEALEREAHERLTDVENDDAILGQSAAEIVAEICKMLGVVVDPALFEAEDLVPPSALPGTCGDLPHISAHPGEGRDPDHKARGDPESVRALHLDPRFREDERSTGSPLNERSDGP